MVLQGVDTCCLANVPFSWAESTEFWIALYPIPFIFLRIALLPWMKMSPLSLLEERNGLEVPGSVTPAVDSMQIPPIYLTLGQGWAELC